MLHENDGYHKENNYRSMDYESLQDKDSFENARIKRSSSFILDEDGLILKPEGEHLFGKYGIVRFFSDEKQQRIRVVKAPLDSVLNGVDNELIAPSLKYTARQ